MSDSGSPPIFDWDTDGETENIDYELLAWVKASERRVDILRCLDDAPKNTTDFANEWETTPEAVRYHLKQLQKGGPDGDYPPLVEVLTPERQHYRLFGLTEHGEEVLTLL